MPFGPPGGSLGRTGCSEDALGVLRRPPGDASGALGGGPGSYSEPSGEPPGALSPLFGAVSVTKVGGNGDMFENDDPLNGIAVFLRSQGIQY